MRPSFRGFAVTAVLLATACQQEYLISQQTLSRLATMPLDQQYRAALPAQELPSPTPIYIRARCLPMDRVRSAGADQIIVTERSSARSLRPTGIGLLAAGALTTLIGGIMLGTSSSSGGENARMSAAFTGIGLLSSGGLMVTLGSIFTGVGFSREPRVVGLDDPKILYLPAPP